MYFLSENITKYIKQKLGYPDDLWTQMQQDYIYVVFTFIEVETNLYLQDNGLNEDFEKLEKLSKKYKSIERDYQLSKAFLEMYEKYPTIQKNVDEKIHEYFANLMAAFLDSLSENSRQEFTELMEEELKSLQEKKKLIQTEA